MLVDEERETEGVTSRLSVLRERRARYGDPNLCDLVRDLVVICSSSRSGSTLLGELLRRSRQVVITSAEINPHFVVPVLGRGPDLLADPSPVCAAGEGRELVRAELSLDLGRALYGHAFDVGGADLEVLGELVAWRLTMQWPHEPIDPESVVAAVRRAGPPVGSTARWFSGLLTALRGRYTSVDLGRYDLAGDLDAVAGQPEASPPFEPIVEMAPYVVPAPWRHARAEDVATHPVVLSTPRNSFRLPLLASLFPNARLRVVHLVRNPAASINGLRDGWLHPDFLTCRIPGGLRSAGYVVPPERADHWCFDLPPQWRELTERPLVEICAEQWRSAHDATVQAAGELGVERHVVRFEDLTGSARRRRGALRRLAELLRVDPSPLTAADQPVVMATQPPRPGRWRVNRAALAPALHDAGVLDMAARLGYEPDPDTWD